VPAKVLRFDARRRTLDTSTEAARLVGPVRILVALLGLILVAIGLGLTALLVYAIAQSRETGLGAALAAVAFLPVPLGMAAYGFDLVVRGITGRLWSRRFWNALEARFVRRAHVWIPVLAVAVLVMLAIGGLFEKGPGRFEGLLLLVALFLHVLCHELGHLIAAGLVGYRPRWLAAGPFVVQVENGKTRVTRSRSWWMFFGGYAAYQPIGQTRAKDFLVIAAGPLANLLLVAAALETWGWPTAATLFSIFLRVFIGAGIAIALLNLMPLPRAAGGVALDGRELLDLRRRAARRTIP